MPVGTDARKALLIGVMAAGIALRLITYLQDPPLALDEARVALNIASRSYGGLLQPLDHDQSAPPLYLWLQRSVVALLGVHDRVLRLLPLAAGIGLVWLTPATLGRLLSTRATVVATALAALSPLLIDYSTSVKQYGVEAALTLFVLALALSCRSASYRSPPAVRLAVMGTLLPWLMAPAGFVLTGVAGCALADLIRGARAAGRFLVWSVPAWAASIALAYLVAYGPASHNPYLRRYWSTALLTPWSDGIAERVWALLNENLWGLALGYPGPPGRHLSGLVFFAAAAALLVLIGGRRLLRGHGWGILALVSAPLLAAIAASVAGIYPVSLRLTLFAAPLAQLLLVAGIDRTMERLSDAGARRAWVLVGSALAVPLLAVSLLQTVRSESPEDVRKLVQELARNRRGEPVYVFTRSIPPYLYYSTDWTAPDRRRLEFVARAAGSGGAAFENSPSRRRVDPSEGTGLVYPAAAGLELYGLATGVEWTPSLGPIKRSPDIGWAEHEARRLLSLEADEVWLLLSRTLDGERELPRELERRGACATYLLELDNATLIRYAMRPANRAAECGRVGG